MQSEFGTGEVGVDGTEAAFAPERPESPLLLPTELSWGEATWFCVFSLLGLTGFSPVPVSVPKPVPVPGPTSPGLLSLSVDFLSLWEALLALDKLSITFSTVVESSWLAVVVSLFTAVSVGFWATTFWNLYKTSWVAILYG